MRTGVLQFGKLHGLAYFNIPRFTVKWVISICCIDFDDKVGLNSDEFQNNNYFLNNNERGESTSATLVTILQHSPISIMCLVMIPSKLTFIRFSRKSFRPMLQKIFLLLRRGEITFFFINDNSALMFAFH